MLDGDQTPPKVAQPPIFGPCLLWPNGCPSQLLLSTCFLFLRQCILARIWWKQPTSRLIGQVSWLGLRVGGHLALRLHSSNEPGELLKWPCHDESTINIVTGISTVTRMWANAQRDGTVPNIGGALCSTPQSLAD